MPESGHGDGAQQHPDRGLRLDGAQVVWGRWRDLNGPAPVLPEFRFDADEYAREIDWAERAARTP